ncbi:MAG: RNA polymerase factor sigma-54 [Chitinophagales bacterium]|nr:RNA polymerase factor sigma-54 [Chitinophagaceae bacterium]MBP9884079.1 RNA polymerase factor sigma-54 [Chitinophagales bacterium]
MLKQGQFQKMLQKLSPQQIQLIKLLQVPTDSLEERIKEELEANPALEEGMDDDTSQEEQDDKQSEETEGDRDEEEEKTEETETAEIDNNVEEEAPAAESEVDRDEEMIVDDAPDLNDYTDDDETVDYKLRDENYPEQDDKRVMPMPVSRSFHEYLEEQLGMEELDEHLHALGEYIIGSIDDDGYLRRSLDAMVDDLAFSQNVTCTEKELDDVLKIIQHFDPPGTGCRDLKECLLLQLDRKANNPEIKVLAIKVIRDYFDEFVKKHYEKLQKQLEIDDELFKQVINTIIHLNPKPGSAYTGAGDLEKIIIPDFYISNTDGELELSLNQMNVPDLRISQQFRDMLRDYQKGTKKDRQQREAVMFIKQKIDSAKWFIDAIRQRQQTLLLTMNAIMEYQYDYLVSGDETKLRPMILKDIAETTGLDISTVSRVANSKYAQTEWGTLRLKSFFSESLSTDSGEEVSTREVKKILLDMISVENKKKPLSDEKLTDLLKEKGYNIARRTVAKYREQLEIPVARLRKEL